jgi:hypothetical protein
VIAAGVELVDHRDISEYVPLIRHDEIDLIFSYSIGALPSPFPLKLLLEESVHQEEPLLFKEGDEHLPYDFLLQIHGILRYAILYGRPHFIKITWL